MVILKPLSELVHEQKRQNIHATKKSRYGSKTVAKIIPYEKVLVQNAHDSGLLLCNVNIMNLAISCNYIQLLYNKSGCFKIIQYDHMENQMIGLLHERAPMR